MDTKFLKFWKKFLDRENFTLATCLAPPPMPTPISNMRVSGRKVLNFFKILRFSGAPPKNYFLKNFVFYHSIYMHESINETGWLKKVIGLISMGLLSLCSLPPQLSTYWGGDAEL
jgi:hypothetical protein